MKVRRPIIVPAKLGKFDQKLLERKIDCHLKFSYYYILKRCTKAGTKLSALTGI